jgi:hypothetical protein
MLSDVFTKQIWAGPPEGSGTITLVTLTATEATGTFTLSLAPFFETATGIKTITQGIFNAKFVM